MRPLPKEPDSDHKKKTSKNRVTGKLKTRGTGSEDKPEISYPTNFEHTMHVGFDAHTGEFTVSIIILKCSYMIIWIKKKLMYSLICTLYLTFC